MICVPISTGELFDKYTILQIKTEKINDTGKLSSLNQEIHHLTPFIDFEDDVCVHFLESLKKINLKLWEIEDAIRIKESVKQFDSDFILLARSVYMTNDERHRMKSNINKVFNSKISDIKSYA